MTLFDLGAEREVEHRVREVEAGFGHPDELDRAGGGIGDDERVGVGEADVLGREDHEAARDVARVLAGFDHAREPVEARIGIRAADRLDERGDDVVVLVVAVAQAAERERGFRVGERDRVAAVFDGERVRDLEHGEDVTRVAFAAVDEVLARVVVDRRRARDRGRVPRR